MKPEVICEIHYECTHTGCEHRNPHIPFQIDDNAGLWNCDNSSHYCDLASRTVLCLPVNMKLGAFDYQG
jgi:hypothetical protein